MSNKGIIFDLDGTLLNTLQDLADTVNSVLKGRGWSTHPVDAYRNFVGDGLTMLIRRAVPEDVQDQSVINECILAAREEYSRRWANRTAPYPGVLEALEELARNEIPMAVLSNKPHEATLHTVGHFFPDGYFQVVQGALPNGAVKPDPEPALEVAARMGLKPDQVYFLGDSNVDMYTALRAKMTALGAAWGFRGREELLQAGAHYILESPQELSEYF
ncbi:HAD-superfamily hydrolase, subfamily IA, variant 3 [Desulfonatronospira thiodismutans ASO3-1]|uniref:phosphoglycolate phosphatase n=1 Tax=Desulfonatronospira thiodismutans ASO3-1 TaxID=555779 RepID=D6SL97_9BACT|nr:HAD family hydrolase [Desulfonatronospira thiodismutans]EFI35458.1 HAD-superfamily hydrolase, subfamily IA, variant 3 [Desulfonatronospira thiodismutans ASO3-1]